MGVDLTTDIEHRPDRRPQFRYRARVRWTDPNGGGRKSASSSVPTETEAEAWIARMTRAAARGITPMTLAEYGDENWDLAMRGLETTTLDTCTAGWKLRVIPVLGHIPVTSITNGIADRPCTPGSPTGSASPPSRTASPRSCASWSKPSATASSTSTHHA
ncbi:hypothetical protein ACFVTF_21880 [Kitasatospora sp. NPDC057940]|uniref:hypothetical protein n=1 Tax=Kitasatospora sp. NPDC057940 TaxID=3346285 RepID=UPI0036D95D27